MSSCPCSRRASRSTSLLRATDSSTTLCTGRMQTPIQIASSTPISCATQTPLTTSSSTRARGRPKPWNHKADSVSRARIRPSSSQATLPRPLHPPPVMGPAINCMSGSTWGIAASTTSTTLPVTLPHPSQQPMDLRALLWAEYHTILVGQVLR